MIEINGVQYDTLKMAPRVQFHVLRRLGPLFTGVAPAVLDLLDEGKDKEQVFASIAASIGPALETLSTLPDEQLDYVLDQCLLHVRRMDDKDHQWHPIYVAQPRGAIRMYPDIDGGAELRLTVEVVKANLAGFFGPLSGVSASSLGALQAPTQQEGVR